MSERSRSSHERCTSSGEWPTRATTWIGSTASRCGENLPDEALDDVLELLKAIATMQQFFKTLILQQELAILSRRLRYTGIPAVLVTYFL